MRENRPYGSEGGEGEPFPTPIAEDGPEPKTVGILVPRDAQHFS
jgi:hypothetical protein